VIQAENRPLVTIIQSNSRWFKKVKSKGERTERDRQRKIQQDLASPSALLSNILSD
jgi:hypothetical protein